MKFGWLGGVYNFIGRIIFYLLLYVYFKIFVILYEIEMFVNKMIYVKYVN